MADRKKEAVTETAKEYLFEQILMTEALVMQAVGEEIPKRADKKPFGTSRRPKSAVRPNPDGIETR